MSTMGMFAWVRVLHFSSLLSFGAQKCSLVWYTSKQGLAHSPTLHAGHLNFVVVSLCFPQHTWYQILLHSKGQCLLCLVSNLFSWLADGACHSCLVVWGWGTLPTSCIRSLTNVSLNCWYDNFEPQEARIIKLLTTVRSRGWKNILLVHFQVCLLMV
jgi:hypothetical protein